MKNKTADRLIPLRSIVFLILLICAGSLIFILPYQVVRENTIQSLNAQQLVLARQAAQGINDFFSHYEKVMARLTHHPDIISMNSHGNELLQELYQFNKTEISAITRIDATGHITYTVPAKEGIIGKDVSMQEHNRLIMQKQVPVVSDVFTAVQGYRTIIFAVPVFRGQQYVGCLSLLIPFEVISKRYLENVRLGAEGYAWMISRKGVELYCPIPAHTGKTVKETSSRFPTVISMAEKMMQGHQGATFYIYDQIRNEETETIKKHAVYHPVNLPENHWSIVVATPEIQALAAIQSFGRWWMMLFGLFFISILTYVILMVNSALSRRENVKTLQEQKLRRKTEQTLGRFLKNAHIPIGIINRDSTVAFLNDRLQKLYGYTLQDIPTLEEWFKKAYPDKSVRDKIKKDFQQNKQKLQKDKTLKSPEERTITCKDGSTRDVIFSYTLLDDQIIISLDDQTEHNRLIMAEKTIRERRERAGKMEAIGLMAGTVAHDLNNILSGIVSYPELLLLQLPKESKMHSTIEEIQKSGLRAAAVVADLLTVARGVACVKHPENLNQLIVEYLESPEHKKLLSLHSAITCKAELESDINLISCSEVHIKKTIMNLATNAAEAVGGQGTITITTRNQIIETKLASSLELQPGAYSVLCLNDTGSGIDKKDLPHIFEPFYTQKKMGRSGTGLGLAVVWNTIQDHNGSITVESDSSGTTFELFFPATTEPQSQGDEKHDLNSIKGTREHILIIDDELQQRDIACQMLQLLGYSTHSVVSGEKAVEYLQNHRTDLLLLDMLMEPNMNGRETYEKIIKINPGQKAVIASGFSHSTDIDKAKDLGASGFIKKPYTLEELGQAVKETLQKRNSSAAHQLRPF